MNAPRYNNLAVNIRAVKIAGKKRGKIFQPFIANRVAEDQDPTVFEPVDDNIRTSTVSLSYVLRSF